MMQIGPLPWPMIFVRGNSAKPLMASIRWTTVSRNKPSVTSGMAEETMKRFRRVSTYSLTASEAPPAFRPSPSVASPVTTMTSV